MSSYLILLGIIAVIVLSVLFIDAIIVTCPMCTKLFVSIGYRRPIPPCKNCR